MNAEEARLILQCRRPRGQDDHDPAISEALAFISDDSAAMELLRREELRKQQDKRDQIELERLQALKRQSQEPQAANG